MGSPIVILTAGTVVLTAVLVATFIGLVQEAFLVRCVPFAAASRPVAPKVRNVRSQVTALLFLAGRVPATLATNAKDPERGLRKASTRLTYRLVHL